MMEAVLQRSSLSSFLRLAKTALDAAVTYSLPVSFVLGNESADIDSVISPIIFAYLRTYCAPLSDRSVHVPLVNLRRADLALRPELRPVLSCARLGRGDLITLSELPSVSQRVQTLRPGNTRWVLIDHNVMQGELGSAYGSRVIGTIDHHKDEGTVPQDCEPRIIRTSGSCASLVVDYFKGSWDALSLSSPVDAEAVGAKSWDAEVAMLALAPILIDTTNLTDTAKVTPGDVDAVQYLEQKAEFGVVAAEEDRHEEEAGSIYCYDRDAYFQAISKERGDIDGLSLKDILRKDYKQWTETEHEPVSLGICSVVKSIGYLVLRAESQVLFLEDLHHFARERQLSVIAVMTTPIFEGVLTRELLVWGVDERGVEAVKRFETSSRDLLGLEKWGLGVLDDVERGEEAGYRRCWEQKRVEHSRKQVAPLLREAILGCTSRN